MVGPCYRCLEPARTRVTVNASEYHEHGADPLSDELTCEYLSGDELDVDAWARDALVLALPGKILLPARLRRPVPALRRALRARRRARLRPGRARSRWDALRQLLE